MDVTCERCGTEYEFDETLVAARGTTVKCTNCGHLFKVFRPGAAGASAQAEPRSWTVRRATGGVSENIASLKELQRLITVGQLTPDDQISRSGEGWKRLGDIAELQTFFQAGAAGRDAQRPAPPPGREPTGGRVTDRRAYAPTAEIPARSGGTDRPPPPPGQPPQGALPSRAGKSTMMGVGGAAGAIPPPPQHRGGEEDVRGRTLEVAVPPPANPPPGTTPGSVRAPLPRGASTSPGGAVARSERPPPPPRAAPPSARPPPPPGPAIPPPPRAPAETLPEMPAPHYDPPPARGRSAAPSTPPHSPGRDRPSGRPLHVDDDDDVPQLPPTRSRSGLWVSLVVLLAIGAGVAVGWDRIMALVEGAGGGDPADPFVAAGDEAMRADHEDGYDEAIDQYTRALAHREHDPRALTGLSRAHALIAQERLFDAIDLEARSADDPALRGEAAGLRREATQHAEEAREHAEAAARHAPGAPPAAQADAEVALCDAFRLSGEPQLAQSRLDRARTLDATRSAESLRVEALLAADRAGNLAAAAPIAEHAVAEDPGLLRARLLLARAQLAAGSASAARAQLQAVLDRVPEHPRARALRDRIDGAGAVATPTPVVVPPTPTTPTPTTPTTTPTTTTTPTGGGDPAPRGGGDYDALVREGTARVENGDARRARAAFEQALRARPGASEATAGMGYVMLAEGNARGALSQFQRASDSGYAEALIGLGDAHRRLGDRQSALTAYERYLQVSPSGRSASIARRQADRLRAELHTESGGGSTTTQHHEGGSTTTTTTPTEGGGGGGGSTGTPETHHDQLPPPRDPEPQPRPDPPPTDVPAIDSEP